MAKSQQKQVVSAYARRPGEGTLVDVAVDAQVSTSGETVHSVGIPVDRTPVPDRKYLAETCTVIPEADGARVIFGQRNLVDEHLRNALVVRFTPRSIEHFLTSMDSVSNPSYEEIAQQEGLEPTSSPPPTKEPEQFVVLTANLALTAMSGVEAAIDFMQMSPFSMARMNRTKQVSLDPVVRVDLSATLFLGLIRELREVRASLKKEKRK